jgi:hypothetical protein
VTEDLPQVATASAHAIKRQDFTSCKTPPLSEIFPARRHVHQIEADYDT